MSLHSDLLEIAGIDSATFYASEDVTLFNDKKERKARVFRKNGRVVYRSNESGFTWDEEKPAQTRH